MHQRLFEHQEALAFDDLLAHAAALQLDLERFVDDLEDERTERLVAQHVESAAASGVRGTPTFFIGDRRHVGPHDARTLIAALESQRRRQA